MPLGESSLQWHFFGVGAEIKHLVLDGKCLSIEVCHSDAQTLDDRELLLMFENCF